MYDTIIKLMINFFLFLGGIAALTLIRLLCMDIGCNWLYWLLGAVLAIVISVVQTKLND